VTKPNDHLAEMQEVARAVAGTFKRRYKTADYDELYQEAWLRVLHARSMYDEWMGCGYLRNAAMQSVSRWLWQSRKPCVTRDIEAMRKMSSVDFDDVQVSRGMNAEELLILEESKVVVEELRGKLRKRLTLLHPARVEGPARWRNPALRAVLYVLVDGQQPKQAAERTGVPLKRLYRETELLKKAAKCDEQVQQILCQIADRRSVISDAQSSQ